MSSSNEQLSNDVDSSRLTDPRSPDQARQSTRRSRSGQEPSPTIRALCSLAQTTSQEVNTSASEALVEALRLHRIKALARRYGIVSFDPRDKGQIRAAANMIALHTSFDTTPDTINDASTHITMQPIRDALEFAASWGDDSADLSGMLTRALVHRATLSITIASSSSSPSSSLLPSVLSNKALTDAEVAAAQTRVETLRAVLACVPPQRMLAVVEDSCSFLLSALSDLCEGDDQADSGCLSKDKGSNADPALATSPVGALSDEEGEEARVLVRSLVTIISTYLDGLRDAGNRLLVKPYPHPHTNTGSVNGTSYEQNTSMTDSYRSARSSRTSLSNDSALVSSSTASVAPSTCVNSESLLSYTYTSSNPAFPTSFIPPSYTHLPHPLIFSSCLCRCVHFIIP